MPLSIMILSTMTIGIITLQPKDAQHNATQIIESMHNEYQHNDTNHDDCQVHGMALSIMTIRIIPLSNKEKLCSAECHNLAQYAECRYTECRYAKSHGTI